MSQTDIQISELRSRRMRSRIVGQENNVRVMEAPEEADLLPSFLTKAIGGLFEAVLKFRGWIIGSLGRRLNFSFTGIFSLFSSTVSFLYTFDWNASDKDLDRQLEAIKNLIASQLGGTLGNLVGYLVCGIVPAGGIFVFNEALGLYLLKEVGEEAFDEFIGNLGALILTTAQGAARAFIIASYKNIRRGLKLFLKNPNSPQSQFMQRIFGSGFNNALKTWGEEGAKPWSFAVAMEEAIDSIKDPALQNFVEEFYEEAIDACVEAGYVIAGGLDSWILQQRQMKTSILGKERIIEIQPNREAEDEVIILSGAEEILKPDLVGLMATHYQIENRDIGIFVGEPLRESIRKKPSLLSLRIVFYQYPQPPWYRDEREPKRAVYTIPGIKRAKVDWQTVKQACGGNNGYLWGRFIATANLIDDDENYAGSMKIYGGSENEAEERLKALLTLSDLKIASLSITEEKKEGRRLTNPKMYKETMRIYPAYFTILNSKKVLNGDIGVSTLTGTYKRRREQILLWPEQEPYDAQESINELFRDR